MQRRTLLIATPDAGLEEALTKEHGSRHSFDLVVKNKGGSAQAAIAKLGEDLMAVIVDRRIQDPPVISVLRKCQQVAPRIPVYILYGEEEGKFDAQDLKNLRAVDQIKRPITLSALQDLLLPQTPDFDPREAIASARVREHSLGSEVIEKDNSLVPIPARNFVSGKITYFDLYVRLGPEKYVKILHAGEDFVSGRLETYLQKGVKSFYIKAEQQEHYVAYCSHLSATAIKAPTVAAEVKVERLAVQGNEALRLLEHQGISNRNVLYAKGYVTASFNLVEELATQSKNDVLIQFLKDTEMLEHGVGVALIAALLGRELEVETEASREVLGVAALLHDIGLQKLPESLRHGEEPLMTPEEIELYHMHPELGAKLLATTSGVRQATLQAVMQHHERRDRKGFPKRVSGNQVNGVAEVVGIADETLYLWRRMKADPRVDFRETLELEIFNGFSFPICEAYRKLFFPAAKRARRRSAG